MIEKLRKRNQRPAMRTAFVATLLSALAVAAGFALASSPVPAPTITSHPANPTTSTSASFSFTDSKPGAKFECKLDRAAFAACSSSGIAYSGPLAPGSHTFEVEAITGGAASSPASYTWTIQGRTPPPPPAISSGPEATTTSKTATFVFTDGEAGVTFLCALDGGSPSACSSPKSYEVGTQGEHTFSVQARDAAGNVSAATSYSWTIVKSGEPKSFTISGSLSALAPGLSRPLPLTVANPNNQPIWVTSLLVSVKSGSTKAGCDGPANLQVTQSSASSANALAIPAHGQVTLPSGAISAPQVLMKDLSNNQDACKGASFTFSYSGIAHS
jgi:hypothetical protein